MDKNAEREAYWRAHVGAWRASGESQKAYCHRQGLKEHSLSYWHLRLARGESAPGAETPLTLIPAVKIGNSPSAQPSLSLDTPTGWRLEFATLPPAAWLAALCAGHS